MTLLSPYSIIRGDKEAANVITCLGDGMAKKADELKGLPRKQEKMLVQKSNPLYSLWKSGLTLSEFKILDVYLSRIDSQHPEKRTVVFEKGELEQLLEVQKISKKDLDTRLDHLLGQVVTLDDPRYRRGIHKVTLFEESEAQPDQDGIWTVSLSCTQKAMDYFFNIEKIGYLRYRLRSVVHLTSRYSYILFCYIEKNRYRKTWTVSLEDLKNFLGATEDTYSQFKYFRKFVLEKSRKEIMEKTDCKFTYESIKKGRRVGEIKFTVETLSDLDSEKDPQITIEQWQDEESKSRDTICEGLSDPAFDAFSEEQLKVLVSLAAEKGYRGKDAARHLKTCFVTAQEKGAKHLFDYVKKMLENEKKKAEKKTGTKFNDIPQRDYNYDDLERQLLAAQDDARRREDS